MVVTYKDSLVSLSELYTGDWILLVSPGVIGSENNFILRFLECYKSFEIIKNS